MERLTRKSLSTDMVWFVDHDNNMDLEPCEMSYRHNKLAIQKLARYEDLEEQGKLVILPCKIGTRIYRVVPDLSVTWPDPPEYKVVWDTFKLQDVNAFGKTVFLSEEEANVALKGK